MSNFPIPDNPEFTSDLRKLETTDPVHADTFNKDFKVLIENDAALKKMVFNGDYGVTAKKTTFDGDTITEVDGGGYTRTTTFNADGSITEQIADSSAKITATKTTVFNSDGSISETIG